MGIEATFKDLKTTLGWRFQKQIQASPRLAKYLLILVMTLFLSWLTTSRTYKTYLQSKVALDKAFGDTNPTSFVQLGLWILQYLMPNQSSFHPRLSLSYAT